MTTNWEIKKIGEVCVIGAGNSAPQKKELFNGGSHPFFRTSDVGRIHFGVIENSSDKLNDTGINKLHLHKKGTLLFPKSGASTFLNHRVLMAIDGYVSSHLATLKAKNNILDDRFLLYFSSTIDARNLMQDQNYPSLRLSDIKGISILLPSLLEQKLIVKVLDEVFEKIAKAKENAEKNLQNARELFESYLQSVFVNTLDGWGEKTLGDLYDITSSKRVFKAEWKGNGVPFYRAREIVKLARQGFVDNELFISEEMYNQYSVKYGIPKEGDIMVTGVGTLGICYVVKNDDKFYFKDGNIIWLKRKSDINSRYVEYAFKSALLRKQIDNSIGATVGTYTIIKAKNTKIPLPPLLKQQYIVQKLDALSAETKKLEARYQKKLTDLEELKKSILQKAFNGELVGVCS